MKLVLKLITLNWLFIFIQRRTRNQSFRIFVIYVFNKIFMFLFFIFMHACRDILYISITILKLVIEIIKKLFFHIVQVCYI